LGHHQCRWGYESLEHLEELDRKFEQYRIPCDGLWLDIDYMEQFKVFTCNSDLFEDCESRLEQLHRRNRRIVPILDPGVKQEHGYPVYESGLEQNVYCRTPEGDVYTGYVWPGRTAFPDFSLPEVRDWWAEKVAGFSKLGFDGYWLDMNDPTTGSAELDDMRFNHGQDDHAAYHNQYALGMQMATQKGLIKAHPNRRPFLISRSGSLGTGRCSAIWTGDNYANEHHMRKSVEISLNLSLSGISFNGPDVPGFGGEPDAELAELWYKQGFLFPFLRNHSGFSFGEREPWRFADGTRKIITHYIRLRYKLMPYLYSLFIEHEKTGRPVMRPVFYEASEEFRMFERTSDEFMIGSSILQAPLGRKGETDRAVVLPIGRWFDAMNGSWVAGGKHTVSAGRSATPFYIRSGSVIPMLLGERETQEKDLCNVELHCFVNPGETVHWLYEADDGESFGYRCGEQTVLSLTVSCSDDELTLTVNSFHNGYRPLTVVPVLYQKFSRVVWSMNQTETDLSIQPDHLRLTGEILTIWRAPIVKVK
jgi:alpha-glucosidase